MLFVATTINYMDRQVLGILVLRLQKEFGWSEEQYGRIITGFQFTYALGLALAGRLIDRLGARWGYAWSMMLASIAEIAHSFARSVSGFAIARLWLGLGEAGNFPAAIKTISEWFPESERALAVGIFNSGSTVGAIVTPLLVPFVAINLGWRAAFVCTGLLGVMWVPLWLATTRRGMARSTSQERSFSFIQLLAHRETWVFLICRCLTEPVWWFYLYWAPKFLNQTQGLTLRNLGAPLAGMYAIANLGGLFGGWSSSFLLRSGCSVNRARKWSVLTCALLVVPVALAGHVDHLWIAVAVLGLAMAGHQGWASNLFAMLADIYPDHAVASITGLTGVGAALAGAFAATLTGAILQWTGNYQPILAWASMSYLVALGLIHVAIPVLQPIKLSPALESQR